MMSSFHPNNFTQAKDGRANWEYEYGFGASNELYTGPISSDFLGMTFPEVAELCLIKLHILLIGVETNSSSGILFNPSPHVFTFSHGTQGIFIAQNPTVVKSAAYYCFKCHEYATQADIVKCNCDKNTHYGGMPNANNNNNNNHSTAVAAPRRPKEVAEYTPHWKQLSQEERTGRNIRRYWSLIG
eukprot:sb/3471428/